MAENRTIDGAGNNLQHPNWGKSNEPLLRYTTPAYEGLNGPSGSNRPNPKDISNIVCAQPTSVENDQNLSDYMWAWGQFLDHEIDLSPEPEDENQREVFRIPLPDRKFIDFNRSAYHRSTGTGPGNPRQQLNALSAFVDAANVYGTNPSRAAVLRTFDGSGKLRIERKGLLPKNPGGLPNAPDSNTQFYIAGDVRANEHAVLTCMHTLFVREHNRLCDELKRDNRFKNANDETIYQHVRKLVGGLMQAITYEEFLPALLGNGAIALYRGYNPEVNPGICNVFSTACYRLGHSMLSPLVQRVKPDGTVLEAKPFKDLFFDPSNVEEHGIEVFLAGLATQRMQRIDTKAVDDIREFLFHNRPHPPLDLAALNIQRGRDHGLPDYNQCRLDYGLARKNSYQDITSDSDTQQRLCAAYGDIAESLDLIDPWIGGLAEDHYKNESLGYDANVGELIFYVLKDQFERLRDGDRFWYENDLALTDQEIQSIKSRKLSKVIVDNTAITYIQDNVFRVIG